MMLTKSNELFEKLAEIEHERWTSWQEYVFKICKINPDNNDELIIPGWAVKHWMRQINTPYKKLSEKEKESDREQVLKYWHLIQPYIENSKYIHENLQEKNQLLAEKSSLERMLAKLPESSVIDRMSLEARKEKVEKALSELTSLQKEKGE